MRRRLAEFLPDGAQGQLLDLAGELLDCAHGPQLRLDALGAAAQSAAGRLPAAGWALLQEWALQSSGQALVTAYLPAHLDPQALPALLAGAAQLPALTRVVVDTQALHDTRLDLSALGERTDPALTVELRGVPETLTEIVAPSSATLDVVHGGRFLPRPLKLRIHAPPAADGKAAPPPRVVGAPLPYASCGRAAPPAGPDGQAPTPRALYERAVRIELNMQATFAPGEVPAHGDPRIVCRHLSLQWIHDRRDHHAAKAGDRAADRSARPFSYEPYESREALSAHVRPGTDAEFEALVRGQPPTAWFEASQFGRVVRREFEGMEVGQQRHFVVTSYNHAMALELQCKADARGEPAYVARLYDPNLTALHVPARAASPAAFEGESFLPLVQDRAGDYFGEDAGTGHAPAALLALYRAPAAPAQDAPAACDWLAPRQHRSPEAIHMLLATHQAPRQVREGVLYAMEQAPRDGTPLHTVLRGALGHRVALASALMERRHPDAAAAFVSAVLEGAPGRLTREELHSLLRADHPVLDAGGEPTRATAPGLADAVCLSPAATASHVRAVLATPDALLRPQDREDLVLARHGDWGRPALFATIGTLRRHAAPDAPRRIDAPEAIHAYAHEIAASATLDTAARARLLGARPQVGLRADRQDPPFAAFALAQGHPDAAAAVACAVLEARLDSATTRTLLDAAGIDLDEVAKALARDSRPDPCGWASRLAQARAGAPACAAAGTPTGITHAGVDARQFAEAGFKVEHADSHPGYLVCSARMPLPQLAHFRLLPGTRRGPSQDFEGVRYLVPRDRLIGLDAPADTKASRPAAPGEPAPKAQGAAAGGRWRALQDGPVAGPAVLRLAQAEALTVAGLPPAFDRSARAAGLRASHLTDDPALLACQARFALPELARWALEPPAGTAAQDAPRHYAIPWDRLAINPLPVVGALQDNPLDALS